MFGGVCDLDFQSAQNNTGLYFKNRGSLVSYLGCFGGPGKDWYAES